MFCKKVGLALNYFLYYLQMVNQTCLTQPDQTKTVEEEQTRKKFSVKRIKKMGEISFDIAYGAFVDTLQSRPFPIKIAKLP